MPSLRMVALCAVVLCLILAPAGSRATSTIGLYADQNGSSCSFSGNASGPLTAYVVVRPDGAGLRGVRFSTPIPACLGAVFVDEEVAPGLFSIGSSETGISVAIPYCAQEPTFALQINYYRTSSDPCCPFPVLQDPEVGKIEGVDCVYNSVTLAAVTAKFNTDATCPCMDGQAPYPPHTPVPGDFAVWVATDTPLLWSHSDYDGDIVSYDVYFGTSSTPGFLTTVTTPSYQPPQELSGGTRYYWRVVVRDVEGLATSGPVWNFTTRPANSPPQAPYNPSPPDAATNVATHVTLAWAANDPDGDVLRYDVYFGDVTPPPLVARSTAAMSYNVPGTLNFATTYYWRIVARDPKALETSGPTWSFTTRLLNSPPGVPTVVSPSAEASNVSVNADLSWNCTDPDGDPITYGVYFGTTNPPPLVASSVTAKTYDVGAMAFLTAHYWQIVARDPSGAETAGPIWAFTTQANNAPSPPANPSPAHNATNVGLTPTLTWTCTDELPGLTYDVYFGTSSSPPLVASDITTNSYVPGTLAVQTAYYWKIVARDVQGLTRTGPVWLFTTITHPTPFSPTPPDNGYASEPLTLRWSTSDSGTYPILCDVYFGTTNPPPLVASDLAATMGQTTFSYAPAGALTVGARYYWRVFAHTLFGGTTGPTWSFVLEQLGDVDRDGTITLADARCALKIALGNTSCAGSGATGLADVNCSPGVTPRDALCIHRRAIGQTCLFCGQGNLTAGESVLVPLVTRTSLTQAGSTLIVTLGVSGVEALEAFAFTVTTPGNASLVSAQQLGATAGYTALDADMSTYFSRVGGYTLDPPSALSTTDFIELRFLLAGALTGTIRVDGYVDDLAGANPLIIVSGGSKGGGELPVMFSRFDATTDGDGVRVAWEFQNEDALERYTLYRGAEGEPTVTIAHGAITATTGSYLDRGVEAGRAYRYEMMVRTSDGDEFRSQMVTVQIPGLELVLGANHPNPFNPQTTIPYVVPPGAGPARVTLAIYDTSGRLVRVLVDENQAGGARDAVWRGDDMNGKTVTSGVYFCVLQVDNERRTRKLVLLK